MMLKSVEIISEQKSMLGYYFDKILPVISAPDAFTSGSMSDISSHLCSGSIRARQFECWSPSGKLSNIVL
jgi:hypothetical protein